MLGRSAYKRRSIGRSPSAPTVEVSRPDGQPPLCRREHCRRGKTRPRPLRRFGRQAHATIYGAGGGLMPTTSKYRHKLPQLSGGLILTDAASHDLKGGV